MSHNVLYLEHVNTDKPHFEFSADKNQQLIKGRHISCEDVIATLDNEKLLDTIVHHNKEKYPNQEIYIIEINGYAYLVPYVRKNKYTVFLKTIVPSRKMTKKYLSKRGA